MERDVKEGVDVEGGQQGRKLGLAALTATHGPAHFAI